MKQAKQMLKRQSAHVEYADFKLNEARKLRHDLGHIFTVLEDCLEHGRCQEAAFYLKQAVGRSLSGLSAVSTGSAALDAILSAKIRQAESRGLSIRYHTVNAEKILNDMGLAVILGNLLDNAVEASIQVEREERRPIDVDISADQYFVRLKCVNGMKPEQLNVKRLESTKAGLHRHGWGLRNIFDEAARHGGEVAIRAQNHLFSIVILMRNELA